MAIIGIIFFRFFLHNINKLIYIIILKPTIKSVGTIIMDYLGTYKTPINLNYELALYIGIITS